MFDPAPTITRASLTSAPTKRAESEDLKVLRKARARIADAANWCAGSLISFGDSRRVCVIGAVALARGGNSDGLTWPNVVERDAAYTTLPKALVSAACEVHSNRWNVPISESASLVWMVNDRLGHSATLLMLDRAIEIETQAAKG